MLLKSIKEGRELGILCDITDKNYRHRAIKMLLYFVYFMLEHLIETSYLLVILKGCLSQLNGLIIITIILFILFELLPLYFGVKNTIKKNMSDLLTYQILRNIISIFLGGAILGLLFLTPLPRGLYDLTHFSTFSQVIILYFCIEFFVYLGHFLAHKFKIPLLSKAHGFHHQTTTNLQWVNSHKEHFLVIGLFLFFFCIFYFFVFRSSILSHTIVGALYLTLNAFSHFHKPVSIPFLDQIFLFPKDHLRHHTKRGGPYGVTLSLFDTIFDTREK